MYAVKELRDICYDPQHELLPDLYLPEKEGPCPVFVFFHGGGFENYRQKDMGEPLSRELAAQGILCVNPAYRHDPKAKFPDYIEDGDLSMLLCFDGHYLAKHGIDSKTDVDGYLFQRYPQPPGADPAAGRRRPQQRSVPRRKAAGKALLRLQGHRRVHQTARINNKKCSAVWQSICFYPINRSYTSLTNSRASTTYMNCLTRLPPPLTATLAPV